MDLVRRRGEILDEQRTEYSNGDVAAHHHRDSAVDGLV